MMSYFQHSTNVYLYKCKQVLRPILQQINLGANSNKKQLLSNVGIFAGLNDKQLKTIVSLLLEIKVNANDIVVKEGELSDALYIIQTGAVEVIKQSDLREHVLTNLDSGACFGEIAVLEKSPRSATVRAKMASTLLVLPSENLEYLEKKDKATYATIMKNIAQNLGKNLQESNELIINSLRNELEINKRFVALGRFLIHLLILLTVYNLTLNVASKLAQSLITALVSIPLIMFFALGSFFMMRNSGYPYSFYGLTWKNTKDALQESLFWSMCAIIFLTGLRLLLITTFTDLQQYTLFQTPSSLSNGQKQFLNFHSVLIFALIYILIAPVQEFIFRGAIQSTLQEFLPGKNSVIWAILITSLLFAIGHLHLAMVILPIAFIGSIFWGVLYYRHKNLLAVSISHALLGCWAFFVIDIPDLLTTIIK